MRNKRYTRVEKSIPGPPEGFYPYPGLQSIYNRIIEGICHHKGLILLTGPSGVGKSLAIQRIIGSLDQETRPVIFQNHNSLRDIIRFIRQDLELEDRVWDNNNWQTNQLAYFIDGVKKLEADKLLHFVNQNPPFRRLNNPADVQLLNYYLSNEYHHSRNTVLFIDNVNSFEYVILDQLLALGKEHYDGKNVLQIVVSCSPQVGAKLCHQYGKLIGLHCPLPALTDDQIRPYLQHALYSGNISSGYSFSEAALQRIAIYSAGVPRLIDAIVEVVLAAAKLTGERFITAEKVVAAFVHLNIGAKPDNDSSARSYREQVQSKPGIDADNQQLARQQRKIGSRREAKAEPSIDASVNSDNLPKDTFGDLDQWIHIPETASPTQKTKAGQPFDRRKFYSQQNRHPLTWRKSAYAVLLLGLLGGAILTQQSDNEGRVSVDQTQKQTQRAVKITQNALRMGEKQNTAGRYQEKEPIISNQALFITRDSDKSRHFAGINPKHIDPESKANLAVGNDSTPLKNVPLADRNSALYPSTTKDNSDSRETPTKAKTRQPKVVHKVPPDRTTDATKTIRKETPDKTNVDRSTGTKEDSDRKSGSNLDEKRPEDQFNIDLFGRTLTIGGEYEFRPVYDANFDLDSTEEDDFVFIDQFLTLEFFYELSESTSLFVDGTAFFNADVYAEDGERGIF